MIRILETHTRRSGPVSMDTMRYGAFSPEDLPYMRNVEGPPLKIWGRVMRVSLSLGGLGEREAANRAPRRASSR